MIEGIFFPVEAGCVENPQHMVSYRLCSDGVYLQKKVGCGFVTVKVEGIGTAPKGAEKIDVLPRQIPIDIYYKTVQFFRDVETKFGAKGTEAYVVVAYDTKNDNFFLYVPDQQVGSASVKYDISGFHTLYPNGVIIMDIHSHTSSMGAFWSGTDDADDNRDRYSMVIGKINQIFPEYKIRFSTMKKRFDKTFDDLFILSDEQCGITSDALDKVTNYVPAAVTGYVHSNGYDPYEDYYKSWGTYGRDGKKQDKKSKPSYDVSSWKGHTSTDSEEEDYIATSQVIHAMGITSRDDDSLYGKLKHNAITGKEFSIQELMGDDW